MAVQFVHLVIAQLNIETSCASREPTLKTKPQAVPHLAYGTFDSVGKKNDSSYHNYDKHNKCIF